MGFLKSIAGAQGLRFGLRSVAAAAILGSSLMVSSLVSPHMARADDNTMTDNDVITGKMDITFDTRTNKDTSGDLKADSPALGAMDDYKVDLSVGKTTMFVGEIKRQPNLYSKILHKLKQPAQLFFDLNLVVANPKDLTQKKNVGKWVGTVPIDTVSGAYDLSGGKDSQSSLRVAVDQVGSQQAFVDLFSGKLVGKAEKKENLASYTYKRLVGDKETTYTAKKVDPMKFESVELAKGPAPIYARCLVNGRLDYDYETGNWLTDGITFNYTLDGKEMTDKITGSIKWVEDPNRATNGKGHYDFNLRFNEDQNKPAAGEGAAFDKMSNEDAFFAVDTKMPALTGTIDYVDSFIDGNKDNVSASKVVYHLNANKLTKQQVMNFFKLWMIAVGPTNDE